MTRPSVLVTGAAGFLGRTISSELLAHGFDVRGLIHRNSIVAPGVDAVTGDVTDPSSLAAASDGVSVIVHAAARVHVMRETSRDSLSAFRAVNVAGTRALLDAARQSGAKTFIFISSVKAVAERSSVPLSSATPPKPVDPYGVSKLEAEQLVLEASRANALSTLTLRLPAVYGPGMGGNMLRLFDLVQREIPIPLGGVTNARSIVYSGNVAAAVRHMLCASVVPVGPFFLADDRDLSTPELIRAIAEALGVKTWLIGIPERGMNAVMHAARFAAGLGLPNVAPAIERVTGSLRVDSGEFRHATGFEMPFPTAHGMRQTAAWYLGRLRSTPGPGTGKKRP